MKKPWGCTRARDATWLPFSAAMTSTSAASGANTRSEARSTRRREDRARQRIAVIAVDNCLDVGAQAIVLFNGRASCRSHDYSSDLASVRSSRSTTPRSGMESHVGRLAAS